LQNNDLTIKSNNFILPWWAVQRRIPHRRRCLELSNTAQRKCGGLLTVNHLLTARKLTTSACYVTNRFVLRQLYAGLHISHYFKWSEGCGP